MRKIVLLSGRVFTGKSKLSKRLDEEFNFKIVKSSKILKENYSPGVDNLSRKQLHEFGDSLDKDTSYSWLPDAIKSLEDTLTREQVIVVDSIRSFQQLEKFRENKNWEIIHIHLYAPTAVLLARLNEYNDSKQTINSTLSDHDLLKSDTDVKSFKEDADIRINTGRSDADDNVVRVAARLGEYSAPDIKCVDVIVGAQYGSEGKGQIAAYLSQNYDVLIRVGGPNAGHTVYNKTGSTYTYHQLPSGTKDTSAIVLLGPGMTINVDKLLAEITDCGIDEQRLYIDPQAMIIEDDDISKEKDIKREIASTGSGGGAAAARKILDRIPGKVKLARDIPQLEKYVGLAPNYRGSTYKQLEIAYKKGLSILLEGTQGSGLSIHHGQYPYVTSRDTNVAGCLAEAGISPSRVRKILMVVRPSPIRVGDPDKAHSEDSEIKTSGKLKHETSLKDIATNAKLSIRELTKYEKTSTTKRQRKIGWFEYDQFRHACSLNAPTDLVLTFTDYIHVKNRNARRFEQLTPDTIKFIEEIERIAQAPVSLINTRFPRDNEILDTRTVIDRRNWTTHKLNRE